MQRFYRPHPQGYETPASWTVTTPEGLVLSRKDVQTAIRRWTSTCTYQRVAFLLGVGSEAVGEYLADERHIPKHVGMDVARHFRRIGGARSAVEMAKGLD